MKNIPILQVDSNVPLPGESAKRGPEPKYPLAGMEIGDSFLFPKGQRGSVQTRASQVSKQTGYKFTVRVVDKDNCRIWRKA